MDVPEPPETSGAEDAGDEEIGEEEVEEEDGPTNAAEKVAAKKR